MAPEFGELREGDLLLRLASAEPHEIHKALSYRFLMIHAVTGEELGALNLRVGSTPHLERYAGHIGYTVYADYRGHHYAARAVRLLAPVARKLGLETVWITCDPGNTASRRTLEIAGATFVEVVDVPADCIIHQSGHPKKCRYRLDVSGQGS